MGKLKFVLLGLILSFAWVIGVSELLVVLGRDQIPTGIPTYIPFWYAVFFSCVWAPIWEELVFRWAPIQLVKQAGFKNLLPIAVLSSGIFGWGHGQVQEGLLIQGVLGMIFCWVYIKTDNILYNILLHSLYNTTIILLSTV